jgi:hypothetical protein
MPILDDLYTLADRTNRELNALHDFFDHSRFVWQSFRNQVAGGYKLTIQNVVTGTTVDQDDLLRLELRYTTEYLATFTFRQFVSTFEAYFFDLLHLALRHNPWQLARKQLDFGTVLQARDRDEIISEVIVKYLNELKYEKVHAWFEALNKAIKLDCPSEDEIDSLAEVKATRDILEHNAGVVNETYLRKAGKKARHAAGETVVIDDTYHLASWTLIKKIVTDTSTAAPSRLSTPTNPP